MENFPSINTVIPGNMTELYRARISGWGIDTDALEKVSHISRVSIRRKGEPKAGVPTIPEKENSFFIEEVTKYETGFEPAVDRILARIEESPELAIALERSATRELGIWVTLDDENRVPCIHFSPDQVRRLSELEIHIDVDVV
jgi:hypothetical protein